MTHVDAYKRVSQARSLESDMTHGLSLDFDIFTNIIWILQNDKEATTPESLHVYNPIYSKHFTACRCALLSLALTCKRVSTPALRALWHRVDELVPILKLITQFSVCSNPAVWKWVIEGDLNPLSHSDWSRFHYYANMIQKMCLLRPSSGVLTGERIHHSVYSRIVDSCSRGGRSENVLFPNLSTLDIIMGPAMLLFQTSAPSLRHVRIRGTMEGAVQIDALTSRFIQDALRLSHGVNLRTLLLDGITITPAILLNVFNVSRLETLHLSFAISDLAYQLIRVLDHEQLILPNLKKLSISCMDNRVEVPDKKIKPPRRRLSLPSLETLVLQGPLDGIAYLCKVIDSEGLNTFTLVSLVHRIPLEEASIYRDICDSLARLSRRFPDPSTLKTLTFDFGPTISYLSLTHISSFFPLFAFENLTSLVYRQYAVFNPSDYDLELMGKSWPNLQVLKIKSPPEQAPRATLQGVKSLIEQCPNLQHLCVTFDACDPANVPRIGRSPLDGSSNSEVSALTNRNQYRFPSKLYTLDVGGSLLQEASIGPVMELFWWLFPEIKTLSYVAGRSFSVDREELWSIVREGLFLEGNILSYN